MSVTVLDQTSQDSKLLYQLCCDAGFTLDKWKERLEASDIQNTCTSYACLLDGVTCLGSGSSSEGVGMDFLGSDIDVMAIFRGTSVIEGNDVSPDESDHMFQMVKASHPAFVTLQLLCNGTRTDVKNTQMFCEANEEGMFVLNGQNIKTDMQPQDNTVHGPALTGRMADNTELDKVFSLHCRSWPSASEEWIHRHRQYSWPNPDRIQEIIESGCEVVPVGSHRSTVPHLEWRLSSSLAEKHLIRTFNVFQIQCYFLLKSVLSFLIKPIIAHALCSYHIKTVMLHVAETTDPSEWREDNLTNCFMACLHRLQSYLHAGFCPQYFIPQHNLFDPKVRGESRRRLLRIVTDLISEGWKCILRFPPLAQLCQHQELRCPCHIRRWEVYCDNIRIYKYVHVVLKIHSVTCKILSKQCNTMKESLHSFLTLIDTPMKDHMDYFPSRKVVVALQTHFKLSLGLVLLNIKTSYSDPNKHYCRVVWYAKQYVKGGKDAVSISCKLMYATFLHIMGDTDLCLQAVNEILTRFDSIYSSALPYCADIHRMQEALSFPDYNRKYTQLAQQCTDVTSVLTAFVHPVVFSKWEIKSSPPGLQHVAERRQLVTEHDHEFSSLLFVDCLVYVHYLLFLCYTDMRKPTESRQSLDMLRQLAEHPTQHYIFYPEIARLLYEYCWDYRSGARQ